MGKIEIDSRGLHRLLRDSLHPYHSFQDAYEEIAATRQDRPVNEIALLLSKAADAAGLSFPADEIKGQAAAISGGFTFELRIVVTS